MPNAYRQRRCSIAKQALAQRQEPGQAGMVVRVDVRDPDATQAPDNICGALRSVPPHKLTE